MNSFQDIEQFIQNGTSEGIIYVSFGSIARMNTFSGQVDLLDAFIRAFRSIPNFKILWKYDGKEIENMPPNVKIAPWFPQNDVLGKVQPYHTNNTIIHSITSNQLLLMFPANPKTKAFISHGGHGGYQEAVYHGVPLVVIPLFADQYYNALMAEAKKIAIMLNIDYLTNGELENAMQDIVTDPRYVILCRRKFYLRMAQYNA